MDLESQRLFRELSIGTRLKRLAELLSVDGAKLYADENISSRVSQFYAIYALWSEGSMTINRLVSLSGYSQSAVSQTLKKLDKEGVIRFCTTDDARERCAELTEAGVALVTRLQPFWKRIEQAVCDAIEESGHDFLGALDALERVFVERSFYDRVKATRVPVPTSEEVGIVPYDVRFRRAFHDLNARWLETYFEIEPVDITALTDPDSYILNSGGEIWFAVIADRAVGCYALKHGPDGVFEFTKFAVDPAVQGRGIGHALMRHATGRFEARGGQRLFLETNTKLKAARAIYLSHGWRDMAPERQSPYDRCNCTMVWTRPEATE